MDWLLRLPLLWVLILLAGCSDPPYLSPEDQVRQFVARGEVAVEGRDLSDAAALISEQYSDGIRRTRHEIRRLLAGYFLRHKSIHVVYRIDQVELLEDAQAQVVLFAGIAGTAPVGSEALSQWRGELLRIELLVALESDEEWRLQSAKWRRASKNDLL
ncbi:MAG: hypothetical protein OI74_07125 [Gammaproteobacteria bacterium (ex Lamellibrachia satsuma)]|nr:MAG: hypothetical protein HPY30_16820 [Gammaproteobacteria bacterium (ex Lamellibrachia satsuma)]RRS33715.1 MAG: hypothetical protein OI74_07125 [Gammaproteobacteria bacterium (ex Lamellibrachia satsuma)]RRS34647.1 MAG: hypothetical protein NV67_12570 [Gammaproteobacteria bacterium (ex Lamellibrachia satsuma)]